MEWLIAIAVVFAFVATLAAAIAGYIAHKALVRVGALEESTHKVQFVPVEPPQDLRELEKELRTAERRAMSNLHSIHDDAAAL